MYAKYGFRYKFMLSLKINSFLNTGILMSPLVVLYFRLRIGIPLK